MIGKYLVLEGIDGSGTSTLLSGLQVALGLGSCSLRRAALGSWRRCARRKLPASALHEGERAAHAVCSRPA